MIGRLASRNRTGMCALISLGVVWLLAAAGPSRADEQGTAARAIGARLGDAVVAVRVTIKYRMVSEGAEAQEEENTSELTATVVDASGLAVCALSEADPSVRIKMMSEGDDSTKFQVDVTAVKYVLGEGREVPAKIVLRDQDLDLAFLRPTETQPEPFKAVDLSQSSVPQVMDELVLLGRLGEAANRAPYVTMDRVTAVVTKPRTLYVAGISAWATGLGIPAFTMDGKVVGITVLRSIPSSSGSSDRGSATSLPVLLPAADILRIAKQATT